MEVGGQRKERVGNLLLTDFTVLDVKKEYGDQIESEWMVC